MSKMRAKEAARVDSHRPATLVEEAVQASETSQALVGAEFSPSEWLLEEYKLLSGHYFHEDNQYWRTVSIFGTLNGALLAFVASTFAQNTFVSQALVPLAGIALCMSWLAALIRGREWRNYIEDRIGAIELAVSSHWSAEDFRPLNLRSGGFTARAKLAEGRWRDSPYKIIANIPSSLTLMLLPVFFMVIWGAVGVAGLQR